MSRAKRGTVIVGKHELSNNVEQIKDEDAVSTISWSNDQARKFADWFYTLQTLLLEIDTEESEKVKPKRFGETIIIPGEEGGTTEEGDEGEEGGTPPPVTPPPVTPPPIDPDAPLESEIPTPEEVSVEIAENEAKVAETKTEITKTEAEIADLNEKVAELEEELNKKSREEVTKEIEENKGKTPRDDKADDEFVDSVAASSNRFSNNPRLKSD